MVNSGGDESLARSRAVNGSILAIQGERALELVVICCNCPGRVDTIACDDYNDNDDGDRRTC
jgi:hypothetical protein